MDEKETLADDAANDKAEQQIRLEQAKKERIEAETKKAKQKSRENARKERKARADKIPAKYKIAGGIALLVVLLIVVAFVIPWLQDDHETQYTSESTLKEAVQIENLSAIDYVYRGIAEKPGKFLWMDNIDYRVKYEAHVRAYCHMSDIEFEMNHDNKLVTAYLPDAEIGTPVLDETKFGYLPESAKANMAEILALCKEDAANELNTDQVQYEAYESLKNIVEALTYPLLDRDWSMEFKPLSEYAGGEANE